MNANEESKVECESLNFESLKYSLLDDNDDILLDSSCDPDLNFFKNYIRNLDTQYLFPDQFHNFLDNSMTNWFLILHLNIRSIKKNFESFKLFLSPLNFSFGFICFSGTWFDDLHNSVYNLPKYISKHQVKSDRRGGGVSIYIHSSIKFKERPDLSIISNDIEMLTLQILSDKMRNILVNVLYRLPVGQYKQFDNFLATFFYRTKNCNTDIHIAGDFNLSLLDHDTNKKVQDFLNLIYQNNLTLTTNKPTRVTMKTATTIDHVLTNSFVEADVKSAVFKTDIYDHFPVCR